MVFSSGALHVVCNGCLFVGAADYVEDYVDKSVMLYEQLRFTRHYASIVKKSHQRASLILRCFKCRDSLLLNKVFPPAHQSWLRFTFKTLL